MPPRIPWCTFSTLDYCPSPLHLFSYSRIQIYKFMCNVAHPHFARPSRFSHRSRKSSRQRKYIFTYICGCSLPYCLFPYFLPLGEKRKLSKCQVLLQNEIGNEVRIERFRVQGVTMRWFIIRYTTTTNLHQAPTIWKWCNQRDVFALLTIVLQQREDTHKLSQSQKHIHAHLFHAYLKNPMHIVHIREDKSHYTFKKALTSLEIGSFQFENSQTKYIVSGHDGSCRH